MPTAQVSYTVSIGGVTVYGNAARIAEGQISQEVALAAGKTGTLSTRTDDDTGVATLGAGHGLVQSDKVDVYWPGGIRHGMTVGVVSGDDVPIDLGAGDVLPAQSTALVVCKQTEINVDFDGDDVKILAIHATRRGHVDFQDSGSASLKEIDLAEAEPYVWCSGQGVAAPITGNPVDKAKVSNGDSANASTFKLVVLYDSTP